MEEDLKKGQRIYKIDKKLEKLVSNVDPSHNIFLERMTRVLV